MFVYYFVAGVYLLDCYAHSRSPYLTRVCLKNAIIVCQCSDDMWFVKNGSNTFILVTIGQNNQSLFVCMFTFSNRRIY